MNYPDKKSAKGSREHHSAFAERNQRRAHLREAITKCIKTLVHTAAVGSMLAASPAHAETQKSRDLRDGNRIESPVPSTNTVYVAKDVMKPSPESAALRDTVRKELADPALNLGGFEKILTKAFKESQRLWRKDVTFSMNPDFTLKLPDDTVEVVVPEGTATAFLNGSEESTADGNSFEVVCGKGKYVCAVTALHNLPPGAPGWTFIPGKSDIAVKLLRPAKKNEDVLQFSPRSTASLIGEIGTTTVESQGPNPDTVPYSGVLLPLSILRHFYNIDDMLAEIHLKFPHINYASILEEGGVCKVLPVQGFKDVSEMQGVVNAFRSGAPELVADSEGKFLNQLVGVQSMYFKVAINRKDGGFHVVCYSGPEQLQKVLDLAIPE